MNDNEYFEQTTPLSDSCGGVAGAALGLGSGLIIGIIGILIRRFDVLSSSLVGLLVFLLSRQHGNIKELNIKFFVAAFVISLILQHLWIGFRILYGLFACATIAILATLIIGYDSSIEMYKLLVISFFIMAIIGFGSWKLIESRE